MSNGPGAPRSPHDDLGPDEPWPRPDPYRPADGQTKPEDGRAGQYRPESGPDGTRAGLPAAPAPDPGYRQRPANGRAAPSGRTPFSELASLREAGNHRTGISPGAEPMKIGLWGSPQSGKTTFLAALQHATFSSHSRLGQWSLIALDQLSTDLLARWTHGLVTDQMFPEATALDARTKLRWRFRGDLTGSKFLPPWRRPWSAGEPVAFDLDLIDVNGEVFGTPPTAPQDVVDQTLRHLADAQGLIFLFDPITERDKPSVEQYLSRPLAEITRLVDEQRRMVGRYLPHHVSVCVTKFDNPILFRQACRAGYVNSDRDGTPRVRSRHAEHFFKALCDTAFWPEPDERGVHGPQFVRKALQHYFHPDRIQYYVTSAIGFYLGTDGQFDPDDFAMIREEENSRLRIKDEIRPINVLEPLVELHMRQRRSIIR